MVARQHKRNHREASESSVDDLGKSDMPVFEVDGLPYIDSSWLKERIFYDELRASRWRQEAHRFRRRTDPIGVAARRAYLTQALHLTYRIACWRRNLALTQAAIVGAQNAQRLGFGLLLRERRVEARLTRKGLARLAGLDDKTIGNIENAGFFVSARSIEALLAVPALRLTWADIGIELLQENPADGRKHRKPRKKVKAIRRMQNGAHRKWPTNCMDSKHACA